MKICRHCQKMRASKSRQLCYRCFSIPDIRDSYPPNERYGPKGEDFYRQVPLDPVPCPHPPGSEGKIAVLAERVSRQLALFHPHDATFDRPALPPLSAALPPVSQKENRMSHGNHDDPVNALLDCAANVRLEDIEAAIVQTKRRLALLDALVKAHKGAPPSGDSRVGKSREEILAQSARKREQCARHIHTHGPTSASDLVRLALEEEPTKQSIGNLSKLLLATPSWFSRDDQFQWCISARCRDELSLDQEKR